MSHYDHRDEEAWRDAASSYRYENEVWEAAVRFVFGPGDRRRAGPAVRALAQRATARRREAYTFSRTDIMPALSVSYALSPSDPPSKWRT